MVVQVLIRPTAGAQGLYTPLLPFYYVTNRKYIRLTRHIGVSSRL